MNMNMNNNTDLNTRAAQLVQLLREDRVVLTRQFSNEALRKIAVETIITSSNGTTETELLSNMEEELKNQLDDSMENAKLELFNSLEDDAEISEGRQAKMTPAEKIDEYLKSTCGVYGYTDDILRAVSAAYGILLEPNL